jgi:hypothetical protein
MGVRILEEARAELGRIVNMEMVRTASAYLVARRGEAADREAWTLLKY